LKFLINNEIKKLYVRKTPTLWAADSYFQRLEERPCSSGRRRKTREGILNLQTVTADVVFFFYMLNLEPYR
jgi:hypothetical protein